MLIYLVIINIITFLLYGVDKYFAIKNMYRISEFILLFFSFIGGVVGALFGIYFFKHKYRKVKFKIFNFIYIILWILILIKYNNFINY